MDISKLIHFLSKHLPDQKHLSNNLVYFDVSESHQLFRALSSRDWWWDTLDQSHAEGKIEPVICVSDKTQFSNLWDVQPVWLLYLTIQNIGKHTNSISRKCTRIHNTLTLSFLHNGKNADQAQNSLVRPLWFQLSYPDITGLCLWRNCADVFQRQS